MDRKCTSYWVLPGITTDLDTITCAVTRDYNLLPQDLSLNTRRREIVEPRQICMFLANTYLRMTSIKTGKVFGMRDHSTVIHSTKVVRDRYKTDKMFRSRLRGIISSIGIDPDRMEIFLT